MRDYVEEQLADKLLSEDNYERLCPVCDICGQSMTAGTYFYDIDGTYVCDEYECINGFLKEFRRSVFSYVESRRQRR